MVSRKKSLLTILFVIGVIVAGFIFLLRGCLSKYDERSASAGILYFEKDGQQAIFSIVKFEKATSYSQKGSMVRKSVSTNYYLQTNDAVTGKKIAAKKIRHHRDIKNHPVEVLGSSSNTAWVFINELMAFDPFTLEQKASLSTIEEKNLSLKGKFPGERRYYSFDRLTQNIFFTAKDGSSWLLDTKTMIASPNETDPAESPTERQLAALEKLLQYNSQKQDSLTEQKNSRLSQETDRNEYNRLNIAYNNERTLLYKERDSLRLLMQSTRKEGQRSDDMMRKIRGLNEGHTIRFNQLKVNADTINGNWYGLYSAKELDKLSDEFQYQPVYDEKARRQLFTCGYSQNADAEIILQMDKTNLLTKADHFLDGGLLVDKQTGQPIQLAGASLLVIYKNEMGNDGKIQVSRVNTTGKRVWSFNTQLKEWGNYIFTGRYLFVIGTGNKELSSNDCNLLWSIDLATGKAVGYDFFADKVFR